MKGMNKKKNNSRMGQLQSGENRRWALMDGVEMGSNGWTGEVGSTVGLVKVFDSFFNSTYSSMCNHCVWKIVKFIYKSLLYQFD